MVRKVLFLFATIVLIILFIPLYFFGYLTYKSNEQVKQIFFGNPKKFVQIRELFVQHPKLNALSENSFNNFGRLKNHRWLDKFTNQLLSEAEVEKELSINRGDIAKISEMIHSLQIQEIRAKEDQQIEFSMCAYGLAGGATKSISYLNDPTVKALEKNRIQNGLDRIGLCKLVENWYIVEFIY